MAGTVVVTASAGTLTGLAAALRALPAPVEERPLLRFAPPLDWRPLDDAIGRLATYGAVALTSQRAARVLAERLDACAGRVPGWPADGPGPSAWAAGVATAEALGRRLGPVRVPEARAAARWGAAGALARAMVAAAVRGPVLFPCGEVRREELPARLRDDGMAVDEVVCYRSVLAGEAEARSAAERAAVVVVASPSVADLLARACPPGARPAMVAVGPTTAGAARASGWPPAAVAAQPTVESVVAAARAVIGAP